MSSSTCIHCGAALNRPGAKFCTTCGKAQPAAEPAAVAASAQPAVAAPIASIPAPPTAPPSVGIPPLPLVADYLAGAILSMLTWWLDNDMPYTPEQMDTLFQQLVWPGVQATLHIVVP